MSQYQHLFGRFMYEFRWRLFYGGIALLTCFLYCYTSFECLFFFLSFPLTHLYPLQDKHFIFTDMGEAFSTSFLCALYFSCLFCAPFLWYLGFCFVRSSLYSQEAFEVRSQSFSLFYFFCLSFVFCYVVSLPLFWAFFISFDEGCSLDLLSMSRLRLEARISTYIMLTLKIFIVHHMLSFFPSCLFFLKKFMNFSLKDLGQLRRRCFFVSLFLAAALSPPDLILQGFFFSIFCGSTEIFFLSFLFYENYQKKCETKKT